VYQKLVLRSITLSVHENPEELAPNMPSQLLPELPSQSLLGRGLRMEGILVFINQEAAI
jgi:hypothetical protein